MQDIELKALNSLTYTIPIYFRFVDDILLAVPKNQLTHVLNTFNSIHNRLQFTHELQSDDGISFLDTCIIINRNKLICDWYHKPIFSGRYLHFLSQNRLCHKIGTIITLVDRALLLSDPIFHQKNLHLVINIFINNHYPIELIFTTINKRLKTLFNTKLNKNAHITDNGNLNTQNNDDDLKYFVRPYASSQSDKFNIFKTMNIRFSYKTFLKHSL